ncbi:asparaginase [Pseudohoeflea coraliihabitans]|uniref:Asparaginase n=1 Tax=Pseudohoeflea coraliihabitans TaxID=2860393 RepID=A0ABS6WU79_9HYPH|nr:asparaginase [Pseudohoeflea sp. DP4N28-3]MBW3098610.1 asparaginase [Pseudohoeflea sp. DP4N28-3]
MHNPVLVEITRGDLVESRHTGRVVVFDADGATVLALGAVDEPVFPRSAIKVLQALPLVESGAAEAYGFGQRELALSCASHSGEPEHAELAAAMLAKAGLDEAALGCGSHWSLEPRVMRAQARAHAHPTPLLNNCSGKHAGFLCFACHSGIAHAGYVDYDHPVQQHIRDAMAELTSTPLGHDVCGTDGCNIPTYAVPLDRLAHTYARLATGTGLAAERARAARTLIEASMAEPFFVAGTRRMCTTLMQLAPGRIYAKTGAEGVYCAAIPELGLGIALKADDGATRAAEIMVAATLARLFDAADRDLAAKLDKLAQRTLKNWNGTIVGEERPADELRAG